MRPRRGKQLHAALWLARGLTSGVWTAHAFVVLAALQVCGQRVPRRLSWIRITLPSGASRRFWLQDFTQARALAEVLNEDDYDIPIDGPVHTIIDLGANAGQASVYLRDRFPDAGILAVEADPEIARLATRNTAADPDTTVIAAAVTDHDGTVTLTRLTGHSWGSNLFAAWSRPDSPRVEVRGVTLSTLLREHNIDHVDVLKVDVEGAELMALTCDDVLRAVRTVIGELHPSILQQPRDEALGLLQRQGGFQHAWFHRECIFALGRADGRPRAGYPGVGEAQGG